MTGGLLHGSHAIRRLMVIQVSLAEVNIVMIIMAVRHFLLHGSLGWQVHVHVRALLDKMDVKNCNCFDYRILQYSNKKRLNDDDDEDDDEDDDKEYRHGRKI
jgi:hypothetical protein